MAEYIKREDVIETIREEVQEQISRMGMHQLHIVDMLKVEDAVNSIPSADVVERKTGKWIERDCGLDIECKCSVCGYRDFIPSKYDRYWFNRKFCPNCGARMVNKDV